MIFFTSRNKIKANKHVLSLDLNKFPIYEIVRGKLTYSHILFTWTFDAVFKIVAGDSLIFFFLSKKLSLHFISQTFHVTGNVKHYYAPNFEEVDGAYWFWVVCL